MSPDRVERLIGTEKSGKITEFRTTSKVDKSFSVYQIEGSRALHLKPGDILKGKILAIFTQGETKEVEVDFGTFKVRARWNSHLTPEIGKNILVLVKRTSPEIVLKLLETKVANLKDFFLKSFSIREEIFPLHRQLLSTGTISFTTDSIRKLVESSGLFLENKIHAGNMKDINTDIKTKLLTLLSKVSGNEMKLVLKALNILESYSMANLLSKNFFLIPLFLPSPPFTRAELFIDKENLKSFHYQGFLTVVIVLSLEEYGSLKISLLFDRREKLFNINFSSSSEKLIKLLRKRQKMIDKLLSNKYKVRISFRCEIPQIPELYLNEIPIELDIKA